MEKDIKVGSRVRERYDYTILGTVMSLNIIDDFAEVKWDDSEDSIDEYNLDDLVLYDPEAEKLMAEGIQSKVDEAKSAFEIAFTKWQEAQDLASDRNINIDDLKYMKVIDMKAFEQVINDSGWLSSGVRSLYC